MRTDAQERSLAPWLSWWRWRLGQDSKEETGQCGDFVEVVAESVGRGGGGQVAIELGNGIRLEVGNQTNVELLRKVVGVLQIC